MIRLDDVTALKQLDASGMLDRLREFPGECQRAWDKVHGLELPKDYASVNKVVILGMGGSAIGGDLVRRLALAETKVPVWVHRDYGLPPLVDRRTLVIASSYSGNTEETLSGLKAALKTPAKKLAITTGGQVKAIAEGAGIPVIPIEYKAPPRAALPHSFVPLVGVFQKLGLLGDKTSDLAESIRIMRSQVEELCETSPASANPAKQLATKLCGQIVVIYGAGILSEVAQRWKGQINENAKGWAFYEVLPELNHNAVVGYEFPVKAREIIHVVLLRSSLLHPRTLLRYEATTRIMDKAGIRYEVIDAKGESALAQMLSMILLGDYTSFYLAMLNGTDPTPVSCIDFLKDYLAKSPILA